MDWVFVAVFVGESVFFPFVWDSVVVSVGEVSCVVVGGF